MLTFECLESSHTLTGLRTPGRPHDILALRCLEPKTEGLV